jgi:hypothetical protein
VRVAGYDTRLDGLLVDLDVLRALRAAEHRLYADHMRAWHMTGADERASRWRAYRDRAHPEAE